MIAAGTRLGPYEILAPLGAGGMGEVYRARDTRLGREVALKVLPGDFLESEEGKARFEREARALAALSHPNIAVVYAFEEIPGSSGSPRGHLLAMELLEGESLRETISRGALALKKTLDIAIQMAEGLAAAHGKGIVHRDIKPENVFLTKDGHAKLLDFGLARHDVTRHDPADTRSPTLAALSEKGVVLGTVAYMSPEQARGETVDFRSDQFSLGTVLYEMLTGKRPFGGASAAEILAAIIRDEPEPVTKLDPKLPAPLGWVVQRCLAKDPEERYASTRDLARELSSLRDHLSEISRSAEAAVAGQMRAGRPQASRWTLAAVGTLGLLAGALLVFTLRRPAPKEPTALRYLTYSGHDRSPNVSPDGKTVAFISDRDGVNRIWLKQIAGGGEAPLTSGPDELPRFSPDGSMILFARKEPTHPSLYRTGIVGGEPRKLLDDAAEGDWAPDGKRILFLHWSNERGRIDSRIGLAGSEGGGAQEIVRVEGHQLHHPRWSPDGRTIAATEIGAGGADTSIFVIDSEKKTFRAIRPRSKRGFLSGPAWSGSGDELVYSQSDSVVAAVVASSARVIRQGIESGRAETLFWSPTSSDVVDIVGPGQMVFDARSLRENLQEFQFSGSKLSSQGRWLTQGNSTDRQPAHSPDGEWVVFSSTRSGNLDLWEISTKTGTVRRLTDDAAEDWDPGFTRDGKNLLWSSNRTGAFEIWIAESDGSGARQVTRDGEDAENPTATPDGQWLVYNQGSGPRTGIWKIHPDGSGATQLVSGNTVLPEVSPDGQYVSYRTMLSTDVAVVRVARVADGRPVPFEVRLRSFAGLFAPNSVGRSRWMPDSRRIVFAAQNEKGAYQIYIQDFVPGQDTTGTQKMLAGFDLQVAPESFGISPDGSRITIAGWEQVESLMIADHVPDVSPPRGRPQ